MPNNPDLEQTLANCNDLTRANLSPFRIVFVNISRLYRDNLTSDELYDAARWCWRVSEKHVKKSNYVFAVHGNTVVGIFANPNWEQVTLEVIKKREYPIHDKDPKIGRFFFTCSKPNQFFESRLRGRTLAADVYIIRAQNPIQYNYP